MKKKQRDGRRDINRERTFLWTDLNYFRQTIIRQTGNFIRDATHYDYDERVEEVGSVEMR